jgi:acetylornithine/succinyldiaminopimelate/putrescine aminotransferase
MPALLETYPPFPLVLERGEGEAVYAEDGTPWLDLYGGHCVALIGHSHPKVVAAMAEQAARLLFYSAAARLRIREQAADALARFLAGAGVSRVFFCNSGAEANENALKLAIKATGRRRIACFEGGWHGRTWLALSATDDPKITAPYAGLLAPHTRIPFGDAQALDTVDWSAHAAVIVEPIQSMSGIRCADAAWFARLREVTAVHGCWLICDEIQTGLGRVGAPSAAEFYGIRPDAMTLAKGLASGVPVGAVMLADAAAATVQPGDLGSTFGGGPIAMAALLATLTVVREERLVARAQALGARLKRSLPGRVVARVRGEGLLLGLECHAPAAGLQQHLMQHRILTGSSGDPRVLRLMPPLTLSDRAVEMLEAAIATYTG